MDIVLKLIKQSEDTKLILKHIYSAEWPTCFN